MAVIDANRDVAAQAPPFAGGAAFEPVSRASKRSRSA